MGEGHYEVSLNVHLAEWHGVYSKAWVRKEIRRRATLEMRLAHASWSPRVWRVEHDPLRSMLTFTLLADGDALEAGYKLRRKRKGSKFVPLKPKPLKQRIDAELTLDGLVVNSSLHTNYYERK